MRLICASIWPVRMPSSSGDFSTTETLPVSRLMDIKPARFVPLGRYSYMAVMPLSVFFSNVSIDYPFGYCAASLRSLSAIVSRLVLTLFLYLNMGEGSNNFLLSTELLPVMPFFLMAGGYNMGRKRASLRRPLTSRSSPTGSHARGRGHFWLSRILTRSVDVTGNRRHNCSTAQRSWTT